MLNSNSKDRINCIKDERNALHLLVDTLTNQNKEILFELDSHVKTNEHVRKQLDRKG